MTSHSTRPALTRSQRLALLPDLMQQRILVLDGGMGTEIQGLALDEVAFRGERFADWRLHPLTLGHGCSPKS